MEGLKMIVKILVIVVKEALWLRIRVWNPKFELWEEKIMITIKTCEPHTMLVTTIIVL